MFCLCLSAQHVIRHSQTFHLLRATTMIERFQLPDGRRLKSRHHQNDFISSSVCRRHSRTYVSSVEWSGWTSPLIYTSLYLAHYAAFFLQSKKRTCKRVWRETLFGCDLRDLLPPRSSWYYYYYYYYYRTTTLGVFGIGPRCRPMATSAPWRPPLANPNPFR